MGRLEEKMARVAGIPSRVTTHIETRADKALEREPKVIARSNDYFDALDGVVNDADAAMDKAERALALLSNAPLPGSTDLPETSPAPVSSPPEVGPQPVPFRPN